MQDGTVGILICLIALFIYLVLHWFYSEDRMERDKHDITLLNEEVERLKDEQKRILRELGRLDADQKAAGNG